MWYCIYVVVHMYKQYLGKVWNLKKTKTKVIDGNLKKTKKESNWGRQIIESPKKMKFQNKNNYNNPSYNQTCSNLEAIPEYTSAGLSPAARLTASAPNWKEMTQY